MPKRKTDYFAVGSGVLSGAKRVKTTVNVGGRSVSASVPLGWSGGQLRKHRRGPNFSAEARASRARLRALDRSDIRFEKIGEALLAKSLRKIRALSYWHDLSHSSWRVGSWWSVVACRRCQQPRYSYARVGYIQLTFKSDGTKSLWRQSWPRSKVSDLFWGRLAPHESSRPAMTCSCPSEP